MTDIDRRQVAPEVSNAPDDAGEPDVQPYFGEAAVALTFVLLGLGFIAYALLVEF